MTKLERMREPWTGPLDETRIRQRSLEGWRLRALVWERDAETDKPAAEIPPVVPFGLQISDDCSRLEENRHEVEILMMALELIVKDRSMSQVAAELSERGFRRRDGGRWTQIDVFDLLPRMIETGPKIFSTEEWAARRKRIFARV